jgi:hypothetical protein
VGVTFRSRRAGGRCGSTARGRPHARWLAIVAIAACHHTPTARERALDRLPADARVVAAADGAVLATPALRHVIDALRPRLPASLGCVIDAGLAADAIALAADRAGATVVIVTRASIASCPALSRLAPGVWTATIGALPATPRSALDAVRWSRARRYLVGAPIALAADLGTRHIVAVAQPDPLDVWVTIDAVAGALPDAAVRATIGRWSGPLGAKLELTAVADQLVVRATGLESSELERIARDVLDALDTRDPARAPAAFGCPPAGAIVIACAEPMHLVVHSVRDTLRTLTFAIEPAIVNGGVAGMRLVSDSALGLVRGDVIVAIDSRVVTSEARLATLVERARGHAVVAVRRGTIEAILDLREPGE